MLCFRSRLGTLPGRTSGKRLLPGTSSMFDDLRKAFQEAVANFWSELEGGQGPAAVSQLFRRLDREILSARLQVERLEEELARAVAQGAAAEREAVTCRRREGLAREAGDLETAEIAARFATRYERKRDIQGRKALVLKDELELCRSELEEMEARLEELRRRSELLAGAAETWDTPSTLEDLEQLLERMGEMEAEARTDGESPLPREEPEVDLSPGSGAEDQGAINELMAEVMLRELKQRLGRD